MPGFNISGIGVNNPDLPYHVVETDRNYRFRVFFGNLQLNSASIKSITRPTTKLRPFEMHYRNEDISFPGKVFYEPATITFYSHSGVTLKDVRAWLNTRVYDVMKSKALDDPDFRPDVVIEELTGLDEPSYRYSMYGAYIFEKTGSNADYSDNNIAELTIVIKYNKLVEEDVELDDEIDGSTTPECTVKGD